MVPAVFGPLCLIDKCRNGPWRSSAMAFGNPFIIAETRCLAARSGDDPCKRFWQTGYVGRSPGDWISMSGG
jgi:hypothetical protein